MIVYRKTKKKRTLMSQMLWTVKDTGKWLGNKKLRMPMQIDPK